MNYNIPDSTRTAITVRPGSPNVSMAAPSDLYGNDLEIEDDALDPAEAAAEMTVDELGDIYKQLRVQPAWRKAADREADYADGNQLDSDVLQKQKKRGIPPIVENMIGPLIEGVVGFEAKTRKDFKLNPNTAAPDAQDVADGLNYKLKTAEQESKADKACADAWRAQFGVGLGWVEVSRRNDGPDKPKYRASSIHRNEIFWDVKSREPDLSDAHWLMRRRWFGRKQLKTTFPDKADLINAAGPEWIGQLQGMIADGGGMSTGLNRSLDLMRGWSVEEQEWINVDDDRVALAEVWYRRWGWAVYLTTSDGRTVEYDEDDELHRMAVVRGLVKVTRAMASKVRMSYWLGPMCLYDGPTPYAHSHFPYIPFWGRREDRTGVPFGVIRDMMTHQDNLNATMSRLRWGLSAVRTERTVGAVAMTDEQFRQQISRVDADVLLDASAMAAPGARFTVNRDATLSSQHLQMLDQSRNAMQRGTGGAAAMYSPDGNGANSGVQEQTRVEQANQSLAGYMDNFQQSRLLVGELLLSLIIQDIGTGHEVVTIPGTAMRPERVIQLNIPTHDPEIGTEYLTNDVQRIRLKVAMEDVPSTSTYRAQQLASLSEVLKSAPPQVQVALMPHLISLMDVPDKQGVIDAVRKATAQETPEAIDKRIKQAVADALAKAGNDLKEREVSIKERKADSEIALLVAEAVQKGVQSAFAAMQAGQVIATMPQVAPVADAVMAGAGYRAPTPMGDDPNFPMPSLPGVPPAQVQPNTHPGFPPDPQQAGGGMQGIQTATPADNFANV